MIKRREDGGIDVLDRPNTVGREERAVARPPQWHAVLLNDAVTPFEFVVYMLVEVFSKAPADAVSIMATAHDEGKAMIMSSTEDVVRTKVAEANAFSAHHGFVLACQAEKG